MAIPRCCPGCGELIGLWEPRPLPTRDNHFYDTCPGKGNHKEVTVRKERMFFGLLEKVTHIFPETYDISTSYQYIGPKRRWLVILTMIFGPEDRLLIDGEWCFYDAPFKLFGDGAEKLP